MSPLSFNELARRLCQHQARSLTTTNNTRRAAVALVLFLPQQLNTPTPNIELLLMHRAEHKNDPWSGHVSFPGGHAQPSDNSLHKVAQRETLEELGFDPGKQGQLIARLSDLQAMAHGRVVPITIRPFVFAITHKPTLKLQKDEVQAALWIKFAHLLDPEKRSLLTRRFNNRDWVLPCYKLGGPILWGLTLKILDELLSLAGANFDDYELG